MFPEPSTSLSITVGLIADLTAINPFDFFVEDWAEHYGFEYPDDLRRDLEVYLRPVGVTEGEFAGAPVHPEVAEFAARHKPIRRTRVIDFLVAINQAVCDAVGYTVRLEAGVQTPEHTLESAMGSCRDSAWLLVALLRELGLAARFVSGYLVQLTSDVKPIDGPSGPDADFTDLHAWAEVYLPGAGWVGLDPTSGLFAGEGHIPLAATPHPSGAAPITGATGPCHATLDFSNTVTRFHEDPRVTLPYTPEQWDRVNALGAMVDERMRRNDVRLTMGGEPTFVSVDDQTAPEWTTAADGPHKRLLASRLAERLKDDYAPQGLVQRSQGKWYPGEPLPRWQIEIVWRKDGEPVWRDPSLLADPWPTQEAAAAAIETETYGSDPATLDAAPARKLLSAFAETLGLPGEQVMPAYEDPLVRMRELAGLPPGDPGSDPTLPAARKLAQAEFDVDLEALEEGDEEELAPESDSVERRRKLLARLDAAVTDPCAYVLPLNRSEDGTAWQSAVWTLRRGRIVLTPGTSPAGLRLPLNSLSWGPAPTLYEADPSASYGAPARRPGRGARPHGEGRRPGAVPAAHRAGRGGPQRGDPRVPAADVDRRGVPRPRRAGGEGRGRLVDPGRGRRLWPAVGSAPRLAVGDPRPRRHRGQRPAHGELRRAVRAPRVALRARPARAAGHRDLRPRRQPRRQPHHARRHHARGLAPAAPARPAGVDAHLLAAAPVAVLPVLGQVHRHHFAGPARRRGARVGALRARDRLRRDRPSRRRGRRPARHRPEGRPQRRRTRGECADSLGHRPRPAAPADRHHRQHPPGRVLHRQALQPGLGAGPTGPARAARLRDAAAPPDGDGAVAARALSGVVVLGEALSGPAHPPRRRPARQASVAPLRDPGHRPGRRGAARGGLPVRDRLARPVHRIPLPAPGHRADPRPGDRVARRDRAVEHAGGRSRPRPARRVTSTRPSSASRSVSSGARTIDTF
ncbi:hypothetical protein GP2_006_00095 [Gordonia paraffinivorans NBRC 108238]|uniref:Transglutaminase-like domain-containing protein n=1 Tax=Gordonia paraffinivorans NBRC 108238 TaxID=1223543 RepID=A0ABQ0IHA5_9ACTN|nr:hypothetical protein GP2_006_00095 [Gordonia paraffinivorans NBRC 108238]